MKHVIFSLEGVSFPVVEKLIKSGETVIVGQIEETKDTLTDEEAKHPHSEDPEMKKRRLSIYDGMIQKKPAREVLRAMQKASNKSEYFVWSESNNSFKFTSAAGKLGYTGLIASQEDRTFEVDREKGKEIVKKYYPGIEVKDYHEFKKIEEGIKFLEKNKKMYVLKSMGDSGETVVPKVDDPEIANQQIIGVLQKDKQAYEQNGFMLEQKIIDGIELTPQIVFWNGKPVFTDLDIETKTIGAGEVGPNKGCGTCVVIKTELTDKLNKLAFPPYVYELAKKHKGMFIVDAGLLFDQKDGKAYFTEFCYQRFGWDAFEAEAEMSGGPAAYFNNIVKGKNPIKNKYGVTVRIFNMETDGDRHTRGGIPVFVGEEAENETYLYDVKKEKDKIVTVGYQQDLGVVSVAGNSLIEMVEECYTKISKIGFKDVLYRPKDDFLSSSYTSSIFNRLQWAIDKELITGCDDMKKKEGVDQLLEKSKPLLEIIGEAAPFLSDMNAFVKKHKFLIADNDSLKNREQEIKAEYDARFEAEKKLMDEKFKHLKKTIKDTVYQNGR